MKIGTKVKIRKVPNGRDLWRGMLDKDAIVIEKDAQRLVISPEWAKPKWVRVQVDIGQRLIAGLPTRIIGKYYLLREELEIIKPIKLKKFSAWK